MALAFHSSAAAVFNINLQPVFCFVVLFAVQCQIIRVFIAVGSGLKQCAIAVLPLFYRLPVFCVCLLHAANGFFIYLFGLFLLFSNMPNSSSSIINQPLQLVATKRKTHTERNRQTERQILHEPNLVGINSTAFRLEVLFHQIKSAIKVQKWCRNSLTHT